MTASNDHFVYIYRTGAGSTIVYVGYGKRSQRATTHPGGSHNGALKRWTHEHGYQIEVAGPYGSEKIARQVEAALISAVKPEFNKVGGDGNKFVPVGVPPELSDRTVKPALTLKEIGVKTNGALLVYLAPGDKLKDGRRKFDAIHPADSDAVSNIRKAWEIGPLLRVWESKPELRPWAVIGVHGPPKHRFVAGALAIDRKFLGDAATRELGRSRGRWEIPIRDESNLDYRSLRGRRLENVRFGAWSHQLHIWVDGNGRVRHPKNY